MASWREMPRNKLLIVVAGICLGMWLLDNVVVEPAISSWSAQSDRIESLRKKVDSGKKLLDREKIIRDRWAEMQAANLSDDDAAAMDGAYRAMARWKLVSGIGLPAVQAPQGPHEENGYDDFEFRASITGRQDQIGRFLYEMETDPIPVNLEECEVATRNANGSDLALTVRFSFARLTADSNSNYGRNSR